ncbi:MAG: flagellar motor switch protein FliM [Mariprofundus sp.]|nr:flagellar motor switch protein FliM [Mariprofundus sp.]
MSEPILAPEEIEALMAEVAPEEKTDAIFASLPPIKQPENITEFKFDMSGEDSPERYPMFVNLQERLSELLDSQWDELFHQDISVVVSSLENMMYKDVISVDVPQVYFVYEVEGYGRMLISFDTALVVAFIDAMLGGEGEASDKPQTLTAVELRLSERIANKLGDTMSELWLPVHPMTFTMSKLDYDPQFLAVTSAKENCFSCFFDIKISEDLSGQMGIYYPRPFLEPILETLRVTVSDEAGDTDMEWTNHLVDSIAQTSASVRFELTRCQINIGDFLHMKPGDFLPINARPNDPCSLWVDEIHLFYAKPGEQAGVLAAEIIEPAPIGGVV